MKSVDGLVGKTDQGTVGLAEKVKQTTAPVGQPAKPSAARSWVSIPTKPTTSPTTAMTTNAAMIIRRTQRGGRPGARNRNHELV
jgi:hypothetical protein